MASLLEVDEHRILRWSRNEEGPSPSQALKLMDLEHAVARASLLWQPPVTRAWFLGANDFLDGASPSDVFKVRGAREVLDALEAEAQTAFA